MLQGKLAIYTKQFYIHIVIKKQYYNNIIKNRFLRFFLRALET